MHEVKALVFDVFGTLVDWRSSIAREAREILSPLGITLDWEAFADAWRNQYHARPNERGPGKGESHAGSPVDISATSITDLANRLGCD